MKLQVNREFRLKYAYAPGDTSDEGITTVARPRLRCFEQMRTSGKREQIYCNQARLETVIGSPFKEDCFEWYCRNTWEQIMDNVDGVSMSLTATAAPDPCKGSLLCTEQGDCMRLS